MSSIDVLEIIYDKYQCLAMVGTHYCKNKVVIKNGCFCSQKHSHLETGEDRRTMYDKMYRLKEISDEAKILEGLVSSEAFQQHRVLAAMIPPEMKRYKTLLALHGEGSSLVRRLKPVADSIDKYIDTFKRLNKRMEALQEVLCGPKNYSAYVTPSVTPAASEPSTPIAAPSMPVNNPVRPMVAAPSFVSNSMDVDPRRSSGKRPGSYLPSPVAKKSYIDQQEEEEERFAIDIDSDEDYSDAEEPTADDIEFSDYAASGASPGLSKDLSDLRQ